MIGWLWSEGFLDSNPAAYAKLGLDKDRYINISSRVAPSETAKRDCSWLSFGKGIAKIEQACWC